MCVNVEIVKNECFRSQKARPNASSNQLLLKAKSKSFKKPCVFDGIIYIYQNQWTAVFINCTSKIKDQYENQYIKIF